VNGITPADRTEMNLRIDELEAQMTEIIKSLGSSREWSLAVTKIEEAAMWMRKAVERM
jgi:hypothetical protein